MKKKVLYIHHGKGIGGAPLSLLYLIQALDKEQYHPIVLFLHDSDAVQLFRDQNIEVVGPVKRYDTPHTRIWWLRWYHAPFILKILWDYLVTRYRTAAQWIDAIKPDIIHLNTSSLLAWGIVAHKKKIPVVWHIRELLASGYCGIRKKLATNIIKHHASAIVPICKHDSRPWLGNKKMTVVYNAAQKTQFDYSCSPDHFITEHNLNPQRPRILFLGGLSAEKGTGLILSVLDKLKERVPQVELLIAGYFSIPAHRKLGRLSPYYRFTQTVANAIEKHRTSITFLGPITNVNEALAASDLLVFPATTGHFARPVIEAGFMKKPVVASSCAPLDELVIHSKTGFLADPHNIDAWSNYLTLLLTTPTLNKSMGEAAYRFCLEHFLVEEQIKKIEHIYEKVMG